MQFDNSLLRELPGTYLKLAPAIAPLPDVAIFNDALAKTLGLAPMPKAAAWLSGAELPPGADPIALAYAGHQFGGFSPQLGDGRAHLLGEFLGPDGQRWDLQLKGSGRTPFSRGGDGKAALGPMLREYLISEAMAALGIPTTRSLAVVTTGEKVWRDAGGLPGAVLARVAASHIRVGSFQFFAARGEQDKVAALIRYTLRRHFPEADPNAADAALTLFDGVVERQARLIAQWMGVGFVHGVMNTDNMALSGETIDYGPCAFLDDYAPGAVFSSIDRQGRYSFANQPLILGWNLARLAEALLPFFDPDEARGLELANARLEGIASAYERAWLAQMRGKLGLAGEDPGDLALIEDLLAQMVGQDWTLTFRQLTAVVSDYAAPVPAWLASDWCTRWKARVASTAAAQMGCANPVVIPRNHLVEEALQAATAGDLSPFRALLAEVQRPYAPAEGREGYALPAPKGFGPYVTFCGT